MFGFMLPFVQLAAAPVETTQTQVTEIPLGLVMIAFAFFFLIGFIAWVMRETPGRAVAVLTAVSAVLVAFPAVIYALLGQ